MKIESFPDAESAIRCALKSSFLNRRQRGRNTVMARAAKLHSEQTREWDEALSLYRGQLMFYLDYLASCNCGEGILSMVEQEVREQFVPDEFKFRFMVRTLVRKVIEHLRECSHPKDGSLRPALVDIPVRERLVHFMRDTLQYSTRDTSLLIGITDAQVENVLSFARKRVDMTQGLSSPEFKAPGWTCFKWRCEDLHLN